MTDKMDFENGRISNFQHHATLTLNFDRVIGTPLCITHQPPPTVFLTPDFIRIRETFCGRTNVHMYGCTYVRMDGQTSRTAILGRLLRVDVINYVKSIKHTHCSAASFCTHACAYSAHITLWIIICIVTKTAADKLWL